MFRKLILSLLILFALIIAAVVAFAYFYEDEVKAYAIQSINKQLTAEVNVGDVSFSVLRTFPLASLEFKNVSAMETWQKTRKDTLFFAESIFLKFNLWDVYNKNYTVKELEVRQAKLNLKVDEAGTENYNFWQTDKSDENKDKENFGFELEKVLATEVEFSYENKKTLFSTDLHLAKCQLAGNFQENIFSADINTEFLINGLSQNQEPLLAAKRAEIKGEIQINSKEAIYTFKKTSLVLDDVAVAVDGFLDLSEETYLELAFAGEKIDFKNALSLLNNGGKEYLSGFAIAGNAAVAGELKGFMQGKSTPHLQLQFEVKDASIKKPAGKLALDHIQLSGNFDNGKNSSKSSSILELRKFSAHLGKGKIDGALKLWNFESPRYELQGNLDLQLAEISHFFDFQDLQSLNGELKGDVHSKGQIKDLQNISIEDWKNANSVGSLEFTRVNFRLKDRPQEFKNISGRLKIVNNSLLAENLQGNISSTDFHLTGKFINLIGFLLEDKQALLVDAVFRSSNMQLDELLLSNASQKEGEEDYHFAISDRINLKLDAQIAHLDFKKFSFDHCSSTLSIKDQIFLAENIHFESMGGIVEGNLKVDAQSGKFLLIGSESSSRNIDIQQLFSNFSNFGQTVLTSSNINGIASAEISFRSKWSPQLQMDQKSMLLDGSFLIQKGRLINFDPLKKLSKYISLDELNDIQFSQLQNNIQIKDETIFIPEFEVRSSVMDLSLQGTHTFSNKINYKMELIVDQLLGMKIKKPKKEKNTAFGYIEDDGLGRSKLFLKMSGDMDNPSIAYDTQQLKKHWKKEIKNEKKEVKEILHEEFGIFKNSAKSGQKEEPAGKSPFQIEWEGSTESSKDHEESAEEGKKRTQSEPRESTKKKEKTGFSKFFDKIAEPNEDEFIKPKKE